MKTHVALLLVNVQNNNIPKADILVACTVMSLSVPVIFVALLESFVLMYSHGNPINNGDTVYI